MKRSEAKYVIRTADSAPRYTLGPRTEEKKYSRRQAMTLALKAAFAGLVTAAVGNEVQKFATNTVYTPVGKFSPMYERHDRSAEMQDPSKLPDPCHGYVLELVVLNEGSATTSIVNFDAEMSTALSIGLDAPQRWKWVLPAPMLEHLAAKNIPLVLCDVDAMNKHEGLLNKEFDTGRVIFGLTASLPLFEALISTLLKTEKPNMRKISRRSVLTAGAVAGVVISGPEKRNKQFEFLMNSLNSDNPAVIRAASRVYGIISNFRSELANEFVRNIIVAHKMLTYSDHLKSQGVVDPHVAFGYHGGHSGIEDFLLLGRPICEYLLSQLPAEYLRSLIMENAAETGFAGIRIINLQPNLTVLHEENKLQPDGSWLIEREFSHPEPTKHEDVIIDQNLIDTVYAVTGKPKG